MNADDGASRDSIGSFSGQGTKLRSGSTVPQASAPPTPDPQQFDYVDLIKYYNRIFVIRVEDFVKKLHPTNTDSKEVKNRREILILIVNILEYCRH